MKKKIVVASSIVAFMSIIAGCGGSSNNDDTTNNNTQTGTAYYVDNAVAGVSYQCGNQKGTTENDGKFIFEKGADCEFSLAGIPLREVPKDDLADGKKIVENNIEVAQLLQSLDADGDLTNGIQITPEIVEAVKKVVAELNVTKPTAVISNENLKEELISEVAQQVPEAKVELKPKEEVVKHLEKTLTEVTTELIAGKTFYIAGMEDGEINFFKVEVNSDATQTTSTNLLTKETKRDKIKIDGNKIYFLDEGDDAYLTISQEDGYILLTDEEVELRAYTNEADAKKYYDSLIKANAITADKIKAAIVGKTLYKAINCDGNLSYDQITISNTTINLVEANGESTSFTYTIEGDTLVVQESSSGESERTQITLIIPNEYIITKDDDGDLEFWAYTKKRAAQHPDDECEMKGNTTVDSSTSSNIIQLLAGKTFYLVVVDENDNLLEKVSFNSDLTTVTFGDLEDGTTETIEMHIEGDKIIFNDTPNKYYTISKQTNDYLIINKYKDNQPSGSGKLFFDEIKAKEYYNSLQ